MDMPPLARIARTVREYTVMFSKKDKKDKNAPGGKSGPQEVFRRPRWKHFVRWFAFLMVLAMDASFVSTSFQAHFIKHIALQPQMLQKEVFGYFLLAVCNMFLLPSMILEVDKVVVMPEKIVLHNLFWRFQEKWTELKRFKEPVFLKFSVLTGRKFLYLINRKDIDGYDTLVETIAHKAPQAVVEK